MIIDLDDSDDSDDSDGSDDSNDANDSSDNDFKFLCKNLFICPIFFVT